VNHILIFLLISIQLVAQKAPVPVPVPTPATAFFEIQLSSSSAPKYEDFKLARTIGYVYLKSEGQGSVKVMLGSFDTEVLANTKLALLKKKGYTKAILVKNSIVDDTDLVYVVQMNAYKLTDEIQWGKWSKIATNIYIEPASDKVKILSGVFESRMLADKELENVKKRGIEGAFVKKIPSKKIHKLTDFEQNQTKPEKVAIDTKVVMALQQNLKDGGYFAGTPDGIFGESSKKALDDFKAKSLRYNMAKLSSEAIDSTMDDVDNTTILISSIYDNPKAAFEGMQNDVSPHSLAYQAYMLLADLTPSKEKQRNATELMNAAFGIAFKDFDGKTKYDYSTKYYYATIGDWMNHLPDIQMITNNKVVVPCWLFEKHPEETKKCFAGANHIRISNLCSGFSETPELKILLELAKNITPHDNLAAASLGSDAQSKLTSLYLSPQMLSAEESNKFIVWHNDIIAKLKIWAQKGASENATAQPFFIAYQEALIRLQYFFAEKGFLNNETLPLSLQVLHALLSKNLESFIKK
jgi:hypothetical protein